MNEEQLPERLVQRMYCLTLYNLSPIQQGIQSAHAIVEYARAFGHRKEYLDWSGEDKTIIILNGGSSIKLKEHMDYLIDNQLVDLAFFKEPDLFNGITACCFLADERIWNREKYPDRLPLLENFTLPGGGEGTLAIHRVFDQAAFVESIGGEFNHRLKLYLEKLRLA